MQLFNSYNKYLIVTFISLELYIFRSLHTHTHTPQKMVFSLRKKRIGCRDFWPYVYHTVSPCCVRPYCSLEEYLSCREEEHQQRTTIQDPQQFQNCSLSKNLNFTKHKCQNFTLDHSRTKFHVLYTPGLIYYHYLYVI